MKYYELDTQISTIFELYEYAINECNKHFGTEKFEKTLEDLHYLRECLDEIWDDAISNYKFEIAHRCGMVSQTMHRMRQRNPEPFRWR